MTLITYAFRYARPVSINKQEIKHEDGHIEFPPWEDSQMDELVRDLAEAYKKLSSEYRLFYSREYDKDSNLRLGRFRNFDEFIKWLSSLDVNHDTKRNKKLNLELTLPIRKFLYESMYQRKANGNSRVVRLKSIVPVVLSNETTYDLNGCPEADFYEAWPLEHWLIEGLHRSAGLRSKIRKLEEIINSSF